MIIAIVYQISMLRIVQASWPVGVPFFVASALRFGPECPFKRSAREKENALLLPKLSSKVTIPLGRAVYPALSIYRPYQWQGTGGPLPRFQVLQ